MKIAITGASGFIGGHVVDVFLQAGYEVRIMTRQEVARQGGKLKNVEVFRGDIRDISALGSFLSGCDGLIHLAGINTPYSKQKEEIFNSNVDATKNILNLAVDKGISKIVFTGSVTTCGFSGKGNLSNENSEFNLWEVSNYYERSKYLGEKAALELYRERSLPVVIVAPGANIGPGDVKPTYTGKLIIDIIREKLPIFFDVRLNFVDVRDVAEGHLLAYQKGEPGEKYLLSNENLMISEFFALVAAIAGKKPPKVKLPLWGVWPIAYTCSLLWDIAGVEPYVRLSTVRKANLDIQFDNAKAKKCLGFRTRPVRTSVFDEIKWFMDNGYLDGTQVTLLNPGQ